MLTTFYPPYHFGGDAIYVQSLAHALADRGDRVTVVHCIDSHRVLAGGTDAGVAESHPGVRVVSLSSRVAALSPTFTYLTGHAGVKERTLQRLFASESFDVVHFHNISLLGLSVLALGTGVKLYTLHDHWLVCPMHVLWKDNREVCLKPSCIRCGLAFRRPPQPWRATGLLKRQLEHDDRFIASSASVFDSHRQRGLDLPGSVVPLFVADPGPVATTRRPPSRFLYVGRLEPIKGVDTLVDDVPRQFECRAKIRYLHSPAEVVVEFLSDDRVSVQFTQPQFGVAPGQAVVFYDGERVLGGGWIC